MESSDELGCACFYDCCCRLALVASVFIGEGAPILGLYEAWLNRSRID